MRIIIDIEKSSVFQDDTRQFECGLPLDEEPLGGLSSLEIEFYNLWTRKNEETGEWEDLPILDQEDNYTVTDKTLDLNKALYELRKEHHIYHFVNNIYLPTTEQLEEEFGKDNEKRFEREPLKPIILNDEDTNPPDVVERAELFRWDGIGVNTPLFHLELYKTDDDKTLYKIGNPDYIEGFKENEVEYSTTERKKYSNNVKQKSDDKYTYVIKNIRERELAFSLKEFGSHSIQVTQTRHLADSGDPDEHWNTKGCIDGLHGIFWEQLDLWDTKTRDGSPTPKYKITKTLDYEDDAVTDPIIKFKPSRKTKVEVFLAPRNWFFYSRFYSPDYAEEIEEGLEDYDFTRIFHHEEYDDNVGWIIHNVIRDEGSFYNHVFCIWDGPPHDFVLPRMGELAETQDTLDEEIRRVGWKIPVSLTGEVVAWHYPLSITGNPDWYYEGAPQWVGNSWRAKYPAVHVDPDIISGLSWWNTSTSYNPGDKVFHAAPPIGYGGTWYYSCKLDCGPDEPNTEPEVGADWTDYWFRLHNLYMLDAFYMCKKDHDLETNPYLGSTTSFPTGIHPDATSMLEGTNWEDYWVICDPPGEFYNYYNNAGLVSYYVFVDTNEDGDVDMWYKSDGEGLNEPSRIHFGLDHWTFCDEGYAKEDYTSSEPHVSKYTQAKNGIRGLYLYNFVETLQQSVLQHHIQTAIWGTREVDWDYVVCPHTAFCVWHKVPDSFGEDGFGAVPTLVYKQRINRNPGSRYINFDIGSGDPWDTTVDIDDSESDYSIVFYADSYSTFVAGWTGYFYYAGSYNPDTGSTLQYYKDFDSSYFASYAWVYTPPNGGRIEFGTDYDTIEDIMIGSPEITNTQYRRKTGVWSEWDRNIMENVYDLDYPYEQPFERFISADRDLYDGLDKDGNPRYDEDECLNFDKLWEKIENNSKVIDYGEDLDSGNHKADPVPYMVAVSPAKKGKLLAMLRIDGKVYYVWRDVTESVENDMESWEIKQFYYDGSDLFGCPEVFDSTSYGGHVAMNGTKSLNGRTIASIKNWTLSWNENSHDTFLGYDYDDQFWHLSCDNLPWFINERKWRYESPVISQETIMTLDPKPVLMVYRERARFDTGIGSTRWANVFHYNRTKDKTYEVSATNRNRDRHKNPSS
ncbi:MAG: hypothetical protein ACFFCZ_20255 [Promethearchaeota archaeon]